jgi:N-methylhydantoinase B
MLQRGTSTQQIGKIKVLTLRAGDVLRIESPSGGGFGSPNRRDPDLVLRDVLDELISVEVAAAVYGVAIVNGAIDMEETARLRQGAGENREGWRISPGPERERYEGIWPIETSIALAGAAMNLPLGVRRTVVEASRRDLKLVARPIEATRAVQTIEHHAQWIAPGSS